MPQTWQKLLDNATSPRDVVAITRDFLATFTPAELAEQPRRLRPPKMFDAQDIASYTVDLVRYHCDLEPGASDVTGRMVEFLSHAATRATHLMPVPNGDHETKESA